MSSNLDKESTKIGSQNVVPKKIVGQKQFNRYHEGQKVTVVSEKYVTAVVTKVWIRHKQITYQVKCGNGKVLNKLPEDALLPHVKKWQYKVIQWLGNKLGINIVTT